MKTLIFGKYSGITFKHYNWYIIIHYPACKLS